MAAVYKNGMGRSPLLHPKTECECPGCPFVACFSHDPTPRRCKAHKSADDYLVDDRYLDITQPTGKSTPSAICEFPLCRTIARYGACKPAVRCLQHKLEGDKHLFHKACTATIECTTLPSYGPPGGKKYRCFQHRYTGDISLGNKTCKEKTCKEIPYFGESQANYCEAHKGPSDVDQRDVKCRACGLCGRLDEQGRCRDCNPNTFERKIREKQVKVKHWLDENLTTPYTLTDRRVFVYGLGCIKQRPDFLFDFPTHVLIVEVDEDQHKSHTWCDEARMINIAQNLRRKTIFIRYNPDEYSSNGREVSCAHEERMVVLREWISKLEDVENVAHIVSCVYLFFDGFDEQNVPVVELKNPLEK